MILKNRKDYLHFQNELCFIHTDFTELSETLNDPNNIEYFNDIDSFLINAIHNGNFNNHLIITNPIVAEIIYNHYPDSIFCFSSSAITPEIRAKEQERMESWLGQMKNTGINTVEGAIEAINVGMPYYKLPINMQLNREVIMHAIRKQYYGDFLVQTMNFNAFNFDEEMVNIIIRFRLHENRGEFLFDNPEFTRIANEKGVYKYEQKKVPLASKIKSDLKNLRYRISEATKSASSKFVDFVNNKIPIWNKIHDFLDNRRYIKNIKEFLFLKNGYISSSVYIEIAGSLITKTGAYADLIDKINLTEILDVASKDANYDNFAQKYIVQIFEAYGITITDNVEYIINKYGAKVLNSNHIALFLPEVENALGMKNIETIFKYVIIPRYAFPLNSVLEKNSIENLIHVFIKLGGSLEHFDENLFMLVVSRFNTNFEVMNEYMTSTSLTRKNKRNINIFMARDINGYEDIKTIDEINDYIERLIKNLETKFNGQTDNDIKICKDIIFILKYGMYSVLYDYNREEVRDTVSYYLKHILNSEKIAELEQRLGEGQVSVFKSIVADWENINNIDDLNSLMQIKNQTISDFRTDKIDDRINVLTLQSDINLLYGTELKSTLTDLSKIQTKTIDPKTGIEIIELNGENFAILNHTLNAYGSGGSVLGFSEKAIGKSYLCTSLITNYNMGHADRGDTNEQTIKLGFVQIQPQQFVMSAPRDIWSQGNENSKFISSKGGMDYMTSIETSKQTIYTHNEFVLYRDAIGGDKISPNCVLCFTEEITDIQRKVATELGIPIVKINVYKYKQLHQERITNLESIINVAPTPNLVKEYLYALTSYTSGYAWESVNKPEEDDFLKKETIGHLVDSLLIILKSSDIQTRSTCISVVKRFVDDCTNIRNSPYDFMKTKNGEIIRIEESCLLNAELMINNNEIIRRK